MCWGVTFVDSSGQEFETIQVKDTVACWLNVHSDVIDSQGTKVGAEQSNFNFSLLIISIELAII